MKGMYKNILEMILRMEGIVSSTELSNKAMRGTERYYAPLISIVR